MKNKILELIVQKPRHYALLIKRNPEFFNWVNANAKTETDHWPSKIFSAVNSVSLICPNGQLKHIDRWNTGLVGCGPASRCECTKKSISESVSSSKSLISVEEKQESNTKRKDTLLEKFGVEYNSQRPDIKLKLSKPKISLAAHSKLSDPSWMKQEYVVKQRSSVDIAQELNVYYSTVASYCIGHGFSIRRRSNYSLTELEIQKYIESQGVYCENSNWSILKNKEIDLFMPEFKFGIEVDGLYWHSFNPGTGLIENSQRHIEKTVEAEKNEIHLMHITDWEWKNKPEIIKSSLASKFGKVKKIFARKCVVQRVDTKEARLFLEKNHIQGFTSSTYYLGLYYEQELHMMISAGKNRFSKSDNVELHRMASKLYTQVVGGGSKLIRELQRITNSSIETYCDRSKSLGNVYLKTGFELKKICPPGYFWTNGSEIISRYKSQKQNLKKWLKTYDPALSEAENMFQANYRRFWDCGNYLFVKTK